MLAIASDLSGKAMAAMDGVFNSCPTHGKPLRCVCRGRTINGPGTRVHASTVVVCDVYCALCNPERDRYVQEAAHTYEPISLQDLVVVNSQFMATPDCGVIGYVANLLERAQRP